MLYRVSRYLSISKARSVRICTRVTGKSEALMQKLAQLKTVSRAAVRILKVSRLERELGEFCVVRSQDIFYGLFVRNRSIIGQVSGPHLESRTPTPFVTDSACAYPKDAGHAVYRPLHPSTSQAWFTAALQSVHVPRLILPNA